MAHAHLRGKNRRHFPDELTQVKATARLAGTVEGEKRRTFMSLEYRQTASLEQAIRERAYRLWESNGWPSGNDLQYWLKAETEIGYEHPRSWAEVGLDAGVKTQYGG
jgi:hypothetical protein